MKFKTLLLTPWILLLVSCSGLEPIPPAPIRPIMSCEDCTGLVYYGPQQAPTPDPRIQMASIITKGVTSMAGIAAGVYGAVEVAHTISDAGQIVFSPGNNTTHTKETVKTVRPEIVKTDVAVPVEPIIVKPEIISNNEL